MNTASRVHVKTTASNHHENTGWILFVSTLQKSTLCQFLKICHPTVHELLKLSQTKLYTGPFTLARLCLDWSPSCLQNKKFQTHIVLVFLEALHGVET